jgi:hypothetical protein
MKLVKFNLLLVYTTLFLIVAAMPAYPSSRNVGRIRGTSSRTNEKIYNKIAIDLVNGKANSISIDNMARLLKNYDIVQFDKDLNSSARDMIIKEIAFRMIRSQYLPRMDDTIKVYRKNAELAKDAIPHKRNMPVYPSAAHGYRVSLVLPVDYARIAENKTIDTLRWPEVSSQASSAIENLWIKRLQDSYDGSIRQQENSSFIDVLGWLKSVYDNEITYGAEMVPGDLKGNVLYGAIQFLFQSWQIKGVLSQENVPAVAALLRQYVILGSPDSIDKIASDMMALKDVYSLHNALIQKVYDVSQYIKQNNPSDYAMLAMLQAMLNDMSDKVSRVSSESNSSHTNLKLRSLK